MTPEEEREAFDNLVDKHVMRTIRIDGEVYVSVTNVATWFLDGEDDSVLSPFFRAAAKEFADLTATHDVPDLLDVYHLTEKEDDAVPDSNAPFSPFVSHRKRESWFPRKFPRMVRFLVWITPYLVGAVLMALVYNAGHQHGEARGIDRTLDRVCAEKVAKYFDLCESHDE